MLRVGSINSNLLTKLSVNSVKYYTTMSNNNTISTETPDVLFRSENLARIVSLNRPKKLNSLNTSMIDKITPRLLEYSKSASNSLVILDSTIPKALCAGGDVASCANYITGGESAKSVEFFQKEYSLNYLISTYSKPYVSYMNGITMGGGVGLSIHAPFRVATETTRFAMPEMDIGFFPDVGATFYLSRLEGKLGYYFALTGEIINGRDNLALGTATHYVPSAKLDELTNRLSNLTPNEDVKEFYAIVNQAIEEFSDPLPSDYKFSLTNQQRDLIEKAFSEKTIDDVFTYLQNDGTEFALKTLEKLSKKSPLSVKVAFEMLNRHANTNIYEVFKNELIAAENFMSLESDFVEGVTTKLITKTNTPSWKHSSVSQVEDSLVLQLLSKKQDSILAEPSIDRFFDITYSSYPYQMGLPTERDIRDYITGEDGSNRKYLPTKQEVLNRFINKTKNKVGVRWKVNNVLERKTKPSEYDAEYVEWVD